MNNQLNKNYVVDLKKFDFSHESVVKKKPHNKLDFLGKITLYKIVIMFQL